MSAPRHTIFTIGHSTHAIDAFIALLQRHGIEAVADVRSTPYSHWQPQFNREALRSALKTKGISYVFLGRELGARSEDPRCYKDGRVQYRELARTALFHAGIQRLIEGAQRMKIALMCAEKEPLECHRTLLVGRVLQEHGVRVLHILANGRVETHEDAMKRLLDLTGVPSADLFRSREELVAEALARQEERIAWAEKKGAADAAKEAL